MTAPMPPPIPGGDRQSFVVDEENVLAARNVILRATEDARRRMKELQPGLMIDSPAEDEISVAAARVWNGNLQANADSHYARLMQYILRVEELGEQLEEAAKQYGYTEEEIAASFRVHADRF
ncbi:hypothetical protein [Parasphingorhabdus pacifica]